MTALQAVLFDLDGVLVDSEPIWFRVEERVMAELGGRWRHEDQAVCVGGTLPETAAYMLARSASARSSADVQRRLVQEMAAELRTGVPLTPGAGELLDRLAAAGVPLGLVSSSFRVLVDAALEAIGADRFLVSVAGDEVHRPKPDPEPYRSAVRRLGADPARCVVFEDSPPGVAAAEAAGCICVGVPDVVPLQPTRTRPVVTTLAEVDLGWLTMLPALLAS